MEHGRGTLSRAASWCWARLTQAGLGIGKDAGWLAPATETVHAMAAPPTAAKQRGYPRVTPQHMLQRQAAARLKRKLPEEARHRFFPSRTCRLCVSVELQAAAILHHSQLLPAVRGLVAFDGAGSIPHIGTAA